MNFLKNFKQTIGYLLFKKIFFGYLMLVSLMMALEIYIEYNTAKKIVYNDLKNTQNAFSSVLSLNIWHFDEELIESNVSAIIKAKMVEGVLILTPKNEIIASRGVIASENKKYQTYIFSKSKVQYADELISHEFVLYETEHKTGELLAKVYFYTSKNAIIKQAKKTLYLSALTTIVSAFFLWLLFIYIANKYLTIPLNQLIKATQKLDAQEYKELKLSLNKERNHELVTLANTFDSMSKRIHESFINLKQLNIIQQEQKQALEVANQYKDDFLANMSHELKTPLNSINIISSVMMKNKDEKFDEQTLKNLKIIKNCGHDLLYLINDILDLSKLEAGKVELNVSKFNLSDTLKSIKEMFEPQIIHKGLEFIYKIDNTSIMIESDESRIKQIIKNLLSNAVKFVDNGKVELTLKEHDNYYLIEVIDEGIGISEDKLKNIFDRFHQVDSSISRSYGGTGLGLAICKQLADLLGASLNVSSTQGVGSKFQLQLPKSNEIGSKEVTKELISKKTKILVLNNNPIMFISLIVELEKSFQIVQSQNLENFILHLKEDDFDFLLISLKENELSKIQQMLQIVSIKSIILSSQTELNIKSNEKVVLLSNDIDEITLKNKINELLEGES